MHPKTVLITGCRDASAGAALAREFHLRGHRVFATTTDGARMNSLGSAEGMHTLALDVTSQASIDATVSAVRVATATPDREQGRLDILINNAAIFKTMPLTDAKLEDGRKIFETNVFGVLAVTQAFFPLLRPSEKDLCHDRGQVINVSSISATMSPPWQGFYASSKAALLAMSHVMRVEFAPLGVVVTSLISGGVATAGIAESYKQAERLPDGSLYKDLSHAIETNESGRSFEGMNPATYAKQVVDDILRANAKPLIWRGAFAWVAWVLTWLGWVGMMDKGQIKRHGLDKLNAQTCSSPVE